MSLPVTLVNTMNEALYRALNDVGAVAGLGSITWHATHELEMILIQGYPTTAQDVADCGQWANLLGLVLLTELTYQDTPIWAAATGAWSLQLNEELAPVAA